MSVKTGLMIVSLLVSIAIGTMLAHANRAAEKGPGGNAEPIIGMSLDTLKEPRWQADSNLFDSTLQGTWRQGADAESANGDRHAADQAILNRCSRAAIDVLVIVPHDGAAMAKGVQLAHDAGVPVIAYDRMIKNCDLDLYMSFDNVKVGRLQAQWIVDHLSDSGAREDCVGQRIEDRQQRVSLQAGGRRGAEAVYRSRGYQDRLGGLGGGLEAGQREADRQRRHHQTGSHAVSMR